MLITDRMRKAFDDCTVMAGVENDFECVYIVKNAALSYLNEIDAENAKLRELVKGLRYCVHESYGMCAKVPVGGEQPFTCCPLYDFDTKEHRCEKLMYELGIEVD